MSEMYAVYMRSIKKMARDDVGVRRGEQGITQSTSFTENKSWAHGK